MSAQPETSNPGFQKSLARSSGRLAQPNFHVPSSIRMCGEASRPISSAALRNASPAVSKGVITVREGRRLICVT